MNNLLLNRVVLIFTISLLLSCRGHEMPFSPPRQNNPVDLVGSNWKITSAQIHTVTLDFIKKTRFAKETITTDSNQLMELGASFGDCRNLLKIATKDTLILTGSCGSRDALPYSVWDSVLTASYPDPQLTFQFNQDSTISLDYISLESWTFSKGDSVWDGGEFQNLASRQGYEGNFDCMIMPNTICHPDSATDSIRYCTYKFIYTIQ